MTNQRRGGLELNIILYLTKKCTCFLCCSSDSAKKSKSGKSSKTKGPGAGQPSIMSMFSKARLATSLEVAVYSRFLWTLLVIGEECYLNVRLPLFSSAKRERVVSDDSSTSDGSSDKRIKLDSESEDKKYAKGKIVVFTTII